MRVLSFIPAFLLAAASFVAAAPTPTPADTSCVSPPASGNGNDAPLQPVIAIIANATAQIQPLSDQLTSLSGSDSCTPDAVSGIVVQITAIVSDCTTLLQASAQVSLTGLDLTNFCATIYALLEIIFTVLNVLVEIVIKLGTSSVGTIQVAITTLLNAVTSLVGCLKVFVGVSLTGTLGPVFSLVCGVVSFLLSIVVNLNVVLGA